jgi:hypothetical protein
MRSNESSALSHWRRPVRHIAAAGLSAAALILVGACSSGGTSPGGTSSGGGAASGSLTPRQALLTAATQSGQIRSATETMTIHGTSGAVTTVTGTIQFQLKPTLLISGIINEAGTGTNTQVKMIFTSTAIYLSEPSLTKQVGKPWVKIDLAALSSVAGSSGAGLTQLVQSLQNNNFTNQAQLFTVAKNTRIVGTQTIDGVSTTEYAGSFVASDGLKALPASFRKALAPGLQALGHSTISFHEWIDADHHPRKVTEVETVNGETLDTTVDITAINQPVSITPPPASQTYVVKLGAPVSGYPAAADLGAKIVPAPSGFTRSKDPTEHSGPMNAAAFNKYMGAGNLAASMHFVSGYNVFYDGASGEIIDVTLFQFATRGDATLFKAGWAAGGPVSSKADPVIAGAADFDSTAIPAYAAHHGVIAIKGTMAFVIDCLTSSTARVPLVETMARQQYAAL